MEVQRFQDSVRCQLHASPGLGVASISISSHQTTNAELFFGQVELVLGFLHVRYCSRGKRHGSRGKRCTLEDFPTRGTYRHGTPMCYERASGALRQLCLSVHLCVSETTHLLSLPGRKEATSSRRSFRTVFPVVLVMPRPTYTALRRPLIYVM